jgi:hypothetical protein
MYFLEGIIGSASDSNDSNSIYFSVWLLRKLWDTKQSEIRMSISSLYVIEVGDFCFVFLLFDEILRFEILIMCFGVPN